mmetsp:Transcript_105896/g.226041  ORF Transcript_105896/g.226041 Transcript_105896/m.226041 type:complete len:289 (+) Transcript_105896:65-931(+)
MQFHHARPSAADTHFWNLAEQCLQCLLDNPAPRPVEEQFRISQLHEKCRHRTGQKATILAELCDTLLCTLRRMRVESLQLEQENARLEAEVMMVLMTRSRLRRSHIVCSRNADLEASERRSLLLGGVADAEPNDFFRAATGREDFIDLTPDALITRERQRQQQRQQQRRHGNNGSQWRPHARPSASWNLEQGPGYPDSRIAAPVSPPLHLRTAQEVVEMLQQALLAQQHRVEDGNRQGSGSEDRSSRNSSASATEWDPASDNFDRDAIQTAFFSCLPAVLAPSAARAA